MVSAVHTFFLTLSKADQEEFLALYQKQVDVEQIKAELNTELTKSLTESLTKSLTESITEELRPQMLEDAKKDAREHLKKVMQKHLNKDYTLLKNTDEAQIKIIKTTGGNVSFIFQSTSIEEIFQ